MIIFKSRYRIHSYRFAGTMPPFCDQAKGAHGQQKPGGSYEPCAPQCKAHMIWKWRIVPEIKSLHICQL